MISKSLLPKTRLEAIRLLTGTDYFNEFTMLNEIECAKPGTNPEQVSINCAYTVIQAHEEYYLPLLKADKEEQKRLTDERIRQEEKQRSYRKVLVTAEELDEVEYHIDPKEFNGTPVPITEQIEWVAANLDNLGVEHKDAPNTATWTMLMHYRPSKKRREDFWNKMFPKVLTSRAAKEEQEAAEEEVFASDAAMEACEQFLMQTAQGV